MITDMEKDQIGKFVAIIFGIIILPILFIVLFSAQIINYFNGQADQQVKTAPLNAYTTREECVEAELQGCTSVMTTEGEELWVTNSN